ncbi:MAG TPA: hypothetical protein VGR06_32330 [Actinophytocola sp.]|uniref:WD40 repeat domain-containing protein n=1 Tax=Actinophytocola sp. TaxID=1872138 RepID=UPI002E07CD77|nr:hypothetical protein [Actinophytocola sp.]
MPIGAEITGLDGHIQSLAFSPDITILVGGNKARSRSGTSPTRTTPQPLASLDRSRQTTWSLAFSPNGHILAAATGDRRLWDIDPERVAAQICSTTGDPISQAERN